MSYWLLAGNNREDGPKGLAAKFRYLTRLNPRIGKWQEADDLQKGLFSRHGGNLRLAIVRNRQRIPLPAFPLPQCRRQRKFQPLPGELMKPVHDPCLMLLEPLSLQDQGAHDVVPPPKERPKGKSVRVVKVFRKVQILVGKGFEILPLHKMTVGGIEIRRGRERNRPNFLLQRRMGGREQVTHLDHDLRLG